MWLRDRNTGINVDTVWWTDFRSADVIYFSNNELLTHNAPRIPQVLSQGCNSLKYNSIAYFLIAYRKSTTKEFPHK